MAKHNVTTSAQHPITSQILAQVQQINVQLPESVEDKWAAIEQQEVTLAAQIAELGLRYMDVRESVGHGNFLKELEQRGMCKRRVQRYISIAHFFLDSPESNATALSHLKPMQVLELTRLPEEKKKTLTPEEIKEYSLLPYRKLGQVVKQICIEFDEEDKVQAENARLKHQLQQSEIQTAEAINALHHEQLKKAPETVYGLPPLVAQIKKTVPALSEQIHEAGLDIANQIEQLMHGSLDPKQCQQAAMAIFAFVKGPFEQLNIALSRLGQYCESQNIALPDIAPEYDEALWEDANALRKSTIAIYEARFHPNNKKRGAK